MSRCRAVPPAGTPLRSARAAGRRRSRRCRALPTALVLAGLLGTAAPSTATAPAVTRPRVAVLGVEVRELADAAGLRVRRALEQAIGRMPALALVPCQTLDEFKLVFGCLDERAACMARGGRQIGADRLLWGSVAARGTQWLVRLRWFDVSAARTLGVVERLLDADPRHDSLVRDLSPTLRGLFGMRVGALVLHLPLAGVEVWVDGQRRAGDHALRLRLSDLTHGSHRVEVRKRGYLPWRREVQIGAGRTTELVVALPLDPALATPRPRAGD